jgi:hypothetical protein
MIRSEMRGCRLKLNGMRQESKTDGKIIVSYILERRSPNCVMVYFEVFFLARLDNNADVALISADKMHKCITGFALFGD